MTDPLLLWLSGLCFGWVLRGIRDEHLARKQADVQVPGVETFQGGDVEFHDGS
jgi:hypothetical protein